MKRQPLARMLFLGRSMVRVAVLLLVALSLSGCGLFYTVVKSEAKLDRLSVPMTKAQVIDEIGRPDRVLRDDGRVLIWEYSLTARKQWMYELALCPLSIWVGGCIGYPFTNIATEHQREYPVHVVLVEDQLCAWGSPVAILQKRKSCTTPGTAVANAARGASPHPEPVVTGLGPINRVTVDRYKTMAVMFFEDAPGATGTGSRVAGMVTTLLLDLDVNIVERTKLEQVLKEQVLRLEHADDSDALQVGKLVGAKAIVVGEVQQWDTPEADRPAKVSLSLRMTDVETGLLLFSGEGHVADTTGDDPENLARLIAHRILARFAAQTGLLGSGYIGVNWELRDLSDARVYIVREIRSGSPAEKAGLRVGDVVWACNGASLAGAKTEREAKRLCQVDVGQTLSLDVKRGDQAMTIDALAEKRAGL